MIEAWLLSVGLQDGGWIRVDEVLSFVSLPRLADGLIFVD